MTMDQETFVQERVVKQQKWYSKEAANNKKWFTRFKVAIIIVAAMIPFATGFIDTYPELQYPIGAMAVIVVILEGLVSFFKYQEKWIEYRSTSEALKKELSFFQYKVGPYEDQEIAFPLFVKQIEGILSDQNENWREIAKQQSGEKKEG